MQAFIFFRYMNEFIKYSFVNQSIDLEVMGKGFANKDISLNFINKI